VLQLVGLECCSSYQHAIVQVGPGSGPSSLHACGLWLFVCREQQPAGRHACGPALKFQWQPGRCQEFCSHLRVFNRLEWRLLVPGVVLLLTALLFQEASPSECMSERVQYGQSAMSARPCMCCMAALLPRAVLGYHPVWVFAASTRLAGFQTTRCFGQGCLYLTCIHTHPAKKLAPSCVVGCCSLVGGPSWGPPVLLTIPPFVAGRCWLYAWLLPLLVCRCSFRMPLS